MKRILLFFVAAALMVPAQAQLLKKLKDKVNQTVNQVAGESAGSSGGSENSSDGDDKVTPASRSNTSSGSGSAAGADRVDNARWCDSLSGLTGNGPSGGQSGGGVDALGISYTPVYKSEGSVNIMYNESSLSLGKDALGYRIILSERINGKTEFVVVENGKEIARGSKVPEQHLGKGIGWDMGLEDNGTKSLSTTMDPHIVADTVKNNTPQTQATTVTINKVDESQIDHIMALAKETDEYKNMTAAEKKEFEAVMKRGMAANNARAGETYHVPAQQAASYAMIDGYRLVVKGKTYAKFAAQPTAYVSADESVVFAIGVDENINPFMLQGQKKVMLDKNKFSGTNGMLIRSRDNKRFVYIEPKKMSDQELDRALNAGANVKMEYTVVRPDGSSFVVNDFNYAPEKFALTNSGTLIVVNEKTGEVYGDAKLLGKFTLPGEERIAANAILLGSDASKMAYYNGENGGALHYLDGTIRKAGIIYPQVVTANGKSYLTWFRKCKKDIYYAKFEF